MGNDPETSAKPQPARPTPVREDPPGSSHEGAAPPPAREGGAPPPAREGAPPPARSPERAAPQSSKADEQRAPGVEPDVDEKTVEVEGTTWTVKVKGRAGGGTSTGHEPTAPLILLGFFPEGDEGGEREALVVGRTLAKLTPHQLERALATAKPPPDPGRSREIFPGTSSRRGRRGG